MSNTNIEGYFSEAFSSFQGEGGTVRGSCFGKRQIFLRFAGCNLANGAFNSSGCIWCDSPQAKKLKIDNFSYEKVPGSQIFDFLRNPIKINSLIDIIKNLITPDLHSISFTGGEPLFQLDFLLELAKTLKNIGNKCPLFLETNGSFIPAENKLIELSKHFKYCCCDIKDRSSCAASLEKWEPLVNTELEFIKKMLNSNVETFAKIVVTAETQIKDVEWIAENLSKIKYPDGYIVGLAIQPAYLENRKLKEKYLISNNHLNNLFFTMSQFLPPESLTLSIQTHKYLNLL